MTSGILLIDKPAGWTSFDVAHKVRRMATDAGFNTTGKKRFPVGHTGTLDPLATGLLVVLVGSSTKQASKLTKLDKTYEVTMLLGTTSTTGDEEGVKTPVSDTVPKLDQLQTVMRRFVGESLQRPPAFSAVKVEGKRAYALARAGVVPDLKPRPIRITDLTLGEYRYPIVSFTTHVSSGTYIRSLVEDIGQALGCGAYMTGLRRTQVGPFAISRAVPIASLSPDTLADHLIAMPDIMAADQSSNEI